MRDCPGQHRAFMNSNTETETESCFVAEIERMPHVNASNDS